MDPGPDISQDLLIFFNKLNLEIFVDLLLVNNFDFWFWETNFGFGWYFAPWIRTFLRIRIQDAKMLWLQRIRILSTAIFYKVRKINDQGVRNRREI